MTDGLIAWALLIGGCDEHFDSCSIRDGYGILSRRTHHLLGKKTYVLLLGSISTLTRVPSEMATASWLEFRKGLEKRGERLGLGTRRRRSRRDWIRFWRYFVWAYLGCSVPSRRGDDQLLLLFPYPFFLDSWNSRGWRWYLDLHY